MIRKKIFMEEILQFLGDHVMAVKGNAEGIFIDNLADVNHTTSTTLDWIAKNKENKQQTAESGRAKVILVDEEVIYSEIMAAEGKVLIVVPDPKLALAKIGNEFFVRKPEPGIHPTAIVHPDAKIGKDVFVGAYSDIGKVVIGDGCVIDSNVKIYDDVEIGDFCNIKSGAVIGGGGFGFEVDENGNRFRFPQIGGCKIGNHVEIGANTCIDRGALSDTVIEDWVKIDNLCHIAHNVHIKSNSMIIACSEISGSCEIGENVWLGPNASVRDWRKIGAKAFIGIGSVVVKNIPENEVWAGNPAKKFNKKD